MLDTNDLSLIDVEDFSNTGKKRWAVDNFRFWNC
jgi:hypothetical protein